MDGGGLHLFASFDCETRAKYFCTDAKILCQSLKSGHDASPTALHCKNILVQSTWVECSCVQFLLKLPRAAPIPRSFIPRTSPKTFMLPPWTAAGSIYLRVLLCETRAQYFCTDAKILCQSLKAGLNIWTAQDRPRVKPRKRNVLIP